MPLLKSTVIYTSAVPCVSVWLVIIAAACKKSHQALFIFIAVANSQLLVQFYPLILFCVHSNNPLCKTSINFFKYISNSSSFDAIKSLAKLPSISRFTVHNNKRFSHSVTQPVNLLSEISNWSFSCSKQSFTSSSHQREHNHSFLGNPVWTGVELLPIFLETSLKIWTKMRFRKDLIDV